MVFGGWQRREGGGDVSATSSLPSFPPPPSVIPAASPPSFPPCAGIHPAAVRSAAPQGDSRRSGVGSGSGPRAANRVGLGFPRARERRKEGARGRREEGAGTAGRGGGDGGKGAGMYLPLPLFRHSRRPLRHSRLPLPSFPPCAGIHPAAVRSAACERALETFGSPCRERGWVWVPACAGTTERGWRGDDGEGIGTTERE